MSIISQKTTSPSWYQQFHISDYVTLLHIPFTMMLLSFVVIGSTMAPQISGKRLLLALILVFCAVQGSHFLDELKGRPWGTRISKRMLYVTSFGFLLATSAISIYLLATVSFLLFPLFIVALFFPVAYSLELWKGTFHTPFWFALSWGFLVCLGSGLIQDLTISPSLFLVSLSIGIMGSHTLILYEATKEESTRALCWSTLRGIICVWILLACGLFCARFKDIV